MNVLSKWKRAAWALWLSGLCLVFLFHFAVTFFYNAPENPITQMFARPITLYMNPVFTQNWRLFAPNPVSDNEDAWVRGAYVDMNGKVAYTEWINVSRPLVALVQENRFTPLQLVNDTLSGSMVNVVNAYQADPKGFEKQYKAGHLSTDLVIMEHVLSQALVQTYPNQRFQSIDVKLVIEEFPDFNHYNEPESKSVNHEINLPDLPFVQTASL